MENERPAIYNSIDQAARAYAAGVLDDAGFIGAAAKLPVLGQNPTPDREWWDDWIRLDGPVSDLQAAFRRRLIPAHLYDAAVIAMAEASHEA